MNQILNLPDGTSIEVANHDYSLEMIQRGDCDLIEVIDGWRLPSLLELELIFNSIHKESVGNFHDDWYWSNEIFKATWNLSIRMGFDFNDGVTNVQAGGGWFRLNKKLEKAYLRLVRHL
jgi:hypothetical protein